MKAKFVPLLVLISCFLIFIGYTAGRNLTAANIEAANVRTAAAEDAAKYWKASYENSREAAKVNSEGADEQCKQKLMDTIGAMAQANKPIQGYGQMNPGDWLQVLQLVRLILH